MKIIISDEKLSIVDQDENKNIWMKWDDIYAIPHLLIIHISEEIRCTRRRVPSSFSHKEGTRSLCDAKAGPAKHLGVSKRETVAGRFRPWRHTLHMRKTKGTHAVRILLFYPFMDTKGV
ncbi:hypothetical protein, partial [Aneurinibacillus migulanus]